MAHRIPTAADPAAQHQWLMALTGFAAFCLTASAIYVLNDLRDLAADRAHPTKRNRAFASGALPTRFGPPMIVLLLAGAGALCLLLPLRFAQALAIYAAASVSYSLW